MRVVGGDAVDLAQLLAEQVGAVQPVVELLDPRQLELLALGQVLGVLPQREPGAFELAGELGLALAAGLVPDLAADLVQRVGGGLDDVKRVQTHDRVRAPLGHRAGDPVGVIAGHQLDPLQALVSEEIEELLGRFAVATRVRPDQLAGVVVDHDREVSLPLANRDLIKPDPLKAREQIALGLGFGGHALADPADRSPRDPHQLRHRGLAGVHGQPRDLVLKAAREARVVPRPRHRGDHHAVLIAADPGRFGFQVGEARPEIQRPPPAAALTPVIARAAPAAMRATITLPRLRAQRDHQRPVGLELHILDHRSMDPEQPLPYPERAHVAPSFHGVPDLRSRKP